MYLYFSASAIQIVSSQTLSSPPHLNAITTSTISSDISNKRNFENYADEDSHQPKRRKLNKKNATITQKIEVLDYIRTKGVNQSKAAKFFDNKWPDLCIKQPIVSSWLKQETKIREQFSQSPQKDIKKSCILKCSKTNEALELWISQCICQKMLLTGEILRQNWKDFAAITKEDGTAELKLSNGWLDSMKAQTSLK